MNEVRKLDALSVAKVLAVLYGLLALIMVLIMSGFIFLAGTAMEEEAMPLAFFGAFGFLLIPVFAAVYGFIIGAIMSWIYNLVAAMVGGVCIKLKQA